MMSFTLYIVTARAFIDNQTSRWLHDFKILQLLQNYSNPAFINGIKTNIYTLKYLTLISRKNNLSQNYTNPLNPFWSQIL